MFDFIGKNQDTLQTKFITWTGDNSAHNVWDNTNEEVTEYTVNITNTLKESLGPDSKIQVFPALGNHDTWPVNVQDFSQPNTNWQINHLKDTWTDVNWLNEEESKVFGQYGYFSKPFDFNSKGRVISLNMQACNDLNWWLLDNRNDPGHQLEWLENELKQVEAENGFVHIIAHIQAYNCLHQFGLRYKALVDRFQHVIRFQTFGHSHDQFFYITRSLENEPKPIGWSLISGSGTSDGYLNPCFVVVEWDEEYMVPTNVFTYIMNVSEANLTPEKEPEWRMLHDFLSEYKLKDLSPSSMLDFT
jgi:hypothetical protein